MQYVNAKGSIRRQTLQNMSFGNKRGIPLDELMDWDFGWTLGSNKVLEFKRKIEKKGIILKNWDIKINYGIKTGRNEAFIIDETIGKI